MDRIELIHRLPSEFFDHSLEPWTRLFYGRLGVVGRHSRVLMAHQRLTLAGSRIAHPGVLAEYCTGPHMGS